MAGRETDSANVRFPPPLVYAGFLLVGLVLDRAFGLYAAIPAMVRWGLGGIALGAGLALVGAALVRFRKAGNSPEPWHPDTTLVGGGIYRFTRNPMYLGMAIGTLGIAIMADSMGALLTLPLSLLAIRTQVIAREEAYLAARFGEPYLEYCRHVRRWL